MKRLTDTFLFDMIDKKNNVKDKLVNVSIQNDAVSEEDLDDNIRIIKRRFNHLLKSKMIKDFEGNDIIVVYNPDTLIEIPTAFPSWLYNNDGNVTSIVNITKYASMSREGILDIDNRTLFALMQSGTISRELYFNWNKVNMNMEVLKLSSKIYTQLFSKVLDKLYGIGLNELHADQLNYVVSKFFLIHLMEKGKTQLVDDLAYNNCFNGSTKAGISDVDANFPDDAYDSLERFIEVISEELNGLSKLNMRTFLHEWMIMFGESTIMALEYVPALFTMVFSSMISAHINKEYIIENVVGNDTVKLYNKISNLFK